MHFSFKESKTLYPSSIPVERAFVFAQICYCLEFQVFGVAGVSFITNY